ncbi:MAG: PIG-L deacetylase family protein, partial [Planctomycetota bacterium]
MPSILAVTAHPDDESFSFGGALVVHAAAGCRCALLCLTDGQAGRTGGLVEREGLGETRRRELHAAARVLGIPQLFTPGLMDGALAGVEDGRGAAVVQDVADRFGADVLVTFGPEGASGHLDHKACWRWTLGAAGERRVYALTWPDALTDPSRGGPPLPITTVVDVSGLGDRKRRAFLEHRTQRDHLE